MKQILIDQYLQEGKYKINWEASNFGSGLYFIKLESSNYSETIKSIVIK